MDIRNKYKVVYIINQIFFDYFLENRKIIRTKKSEYPNGHSDILIIASITSSCLQVQVSPHQ